MVFGTYRDLFTAIAGCAAALTGLLFVAISVASGRSQAARPGAARQFRAAASLLAFTNVLAVSLFGLVPQNNVGYPAVVVAVIGIMFTAAGVRSILVGSSVRLLLQHGLGLIGLLLLTFSVELTSGIAVMLNSSNHAALEALSNVLVACLLIGVARAWELVGDRDTGLITSIAVLAGRSPPSYSSFEIDPSGRTETGAADAGATDATGDHEPGPRPPSDAGTPDAAPPAG